MNRAVKFFTAAALVLTILSLCACGKAKAQKTLIYGDTDLSKYVTLGEYKGLTVDTSSDEYKTAYDAVVTGDMTANNIFDKKLEGTVQKGDTVNIDYEGKRDGVAFEGGTAQGYDLKIGSGRFIAGFEDGLIGVNIGDTVDLNLTFPENYHSADLAGAAVVFTVKVNYVKDTLSPGIDEHYEELGFKSVKEYETGAKKRAIKNILSQKAVDGSKVKDCPKEDKNILVDAVYEYYDSYYNKAYNVSFEDVLKNNNMTVEDFKNEMFETADEQMKVQMINYCILQKEGLKAEYDLPENQKTGQSVLDEITKVENTVRDFLYDNAKIK